MTILIAAVILAAGAGLAAGFFWGRKQKKSPGQVETLLKKLEELVLENFSSLSLMLHFEKVLASLLSILGSHAGVISSLLLRYDGISLSDIQQNRKIDDETQISAFKNFLKDDSLRDSKGFKVYEDYYECGQQASAFDLGKALAVKGHADQARVFPIVFDFLGIQYYFILFYRKKAVTADLSRFFVYLKRQLFLVLYLKELSARNKDNFEFLDGVFQKNPVSMCLTDTEGLITKYNKGFVTLFGKSLLNVKQMMDQQSFQRVLEGHILEKDFYYEKRNLKVRGTPLYSTGGVIRGCLFTILDDSLQYLLFKKLEASEERYKKLLKELPVGLAIVNQEGSIYFVNDNFMNSLGFSDDEKIKGNLLQDFFDIPYNHFQEITSQIEDRDYLFLKFSLKGKYGSRVFSVHLQKIFLGEDELIEAIFQDISLENKLYAQLEEKSKLIEEDLNTARLIWEHILSIPPIYSSLLRFETFFKPSSQLGGDFYDVLQIDEVHVGVIIADVSGHGVSASLITSMLKMLVELAPRDPHRIDDMMSYFNMVLMKVLPEDQYITMFFGIIDTKNYTMEYLNCGHPFPVIFDEKTHQIDILKGMSYPLGTKRNANYADSVKKAQLPANCKILFYTDGILAFRKPDRLLRLEDLIAIFEKSVYLQSKDILNDIYMKILKTSSQFTDDDVSMLLVSLSRELAFKKAISIPSNVLEIDNAILKITESITKVVTIDDEERWKIYTALYEAIINAVEHGNQFNVQKRVTVIYRIYENWAAFKVRDEGIGFKVNEVPNPLDDSNLLKPSGRGVYMIKKMMSKVKYNSNGNEVTMFLKLKNERQKKS